MEAANSSLDSFFLDVSVIYLYAVVSDRKGNIMLQKLYVFFRKETVLSIAVILALLSMFWVRPDKAYFTYIDFRTLGLLFCLMAIVAGLNAVGVFDILAKKLLMGTSGTVGVIRLLVLLCFFLSMVITNDVALITFVPLVLIIVHKLPKELGNYWLLKIVAMQTIAANLGSMLTPIGNPQNLYLYARAGMSAAELITLMLPYSATALILLLIWIQVAAAKAPHVCGSEKDKTLFGFSDRKELNMEYLAAYLILFTICLLTVARIIPYQIPLVLVLIYMLLRNRENISRVDYSLLATFIALFIFIGNLGRIPQFSSFLERIMAGRETLTAVLASQIMSNVPAALLLSGFTDNYRALIVGTNIGGLGTLIASMASFMKNNQIFTNAAYLTFIVSALFFFVGVFLSESLVRILGADDTMFALTNTYSKVMLLFAPAFFTNNLLQCFVRNDGNPALSMAAMITGSISNVILDYIFIFPLSMGIFGSIFATGLSPIISIIVLSPYSHFIKK